MHPYKLWLLFVNLIGGAAVLGSYAWGFAAAPDPARSLWGGVPHGLRPVYTLSMLTAALGYFAFTIFILFKLDAERTRLGERFGYGLFNALYASVLFPSALWMPLTVAALASPGALAVWAVRIVLIVIGLASLGLLAALLSLKAQRRDWHHRLAVIGCAFFCVQTAVLDAGIWSAFFHP